MIRVEDVTKSFDGGTLAIDRVSFHVEENTTLALIGPSGCGKTTLLRMLNRLLTPTSGRIYMGGANILEQDPVALRRRIGYVGQKGQLFPHWTVERSIATVPRLQNWPAEKTRRRVRQLLRLVDMDPDSYHRRYPGELSGGQQQRVAIARALASDPKVVLLDEPFSALDPLTRQELQEEFISIKGQMSKTLVLVTHDLPEAYRIADRILLLKEGKVQQYGTRQDLQDSPANAFVEDFVRAHE